MRTKPAMTITTFAVSLALGAAACSGSTSSPVATGAPQPTTAVSGVDPNAPEIVEPGDIPDNQVFIVFDSADGVYSIKVPEGWARTDRVGVVTFTDKYNSIELRSASASAAPSIDSVRTNGLADVAADATYKLLDVTSVSRSAGTAVLATYEIGSAPNAVTGKKALLAVERYVFFHNGNMVTDTLSGAKGADNVDPWKVVSDSLTWK